MHRMRMPAHGMRIFLFPVAYPMRIFRLLLALLLLTPCLRTADAAPPEPLTALRVEHHVSSLGADGVQRDARFAERVTRQRGSAIATTPAPAQGAGNKPSAPYATEWSCPQIRGHSGRYRLRRDVFGWRGHSNH